jgi:uncharacterized protein (TIGR02246 family)
MRKLYVPLVVGGAILGGALAGAGFAGAAGSKASYAEDRVEIQNLQARYMFAMDFRDADTYAGTFAPDGVLDYAGGVEHGRAEIAGMINGMKKRAAEAAAKDTSGLRPARMRHNITNMVLKIDGDRATGRAYWVAFNDNNPDRKAEIAGYGHYEDEMQKIDGQWYFTKRKIYNEQFAPRAAGDQNPAW